MSGRRVKKRKRINPRFLLVCFVLLLALGGLWALLPRGPQADGVALPDYVQEDYLPLNEWSRPGTELPQIKGVVIHYVGNPGTTAQQNRDYYAQETTSVSSHFVVGLEGEIIQCVPLNEKSSASNDRNRDTLSIETCHPDDTGVFTGETYDSLVRLTAYLCDLCGFDSSRVIRHYDVTGKECPRWFVQDEAAWTGFLADVDAARTK